MAAASDVSSSVHTTPSVNRPSYNPADDDCDPEVFYVLNIGPPFFYPIPSFDVLCVELRQMRIQGTSSDGQIQEYDVFIREDLSLAQTLPSWMIVLDCLVVKPQEFGVCVNLSGLKLPPLGIYIAWEWKWSDTEPESEESEQESGTFCSVDGNINPYLQSDSEPETAEVAQVEANPSTPFQLPEVTHTVTFKCIGSTYHAEAQEALSKAAALLRDGQEIPVRVVKEPENQFDSRAVAFQCKLQGCWVRIGYVVKEIVEHVHKALDEKKIMNVKFSWVKYVVTWHSGPGFYAGINISLNGEWPVVVCQCRSTK